jgi:hypothetical protein
VWWKTTEIHRPPLPHDQMQRLAIEVPQSRLALPVHIQLYLLAPLAAQAEGVDGSAQQLVRHMVLEALGGPPSAQVGPAAQHPPARRRRVRRAQQRWPPQDRWPSPARRHPPTVMGPLALQARITVGVTVEAPGGCSHHGDGWRPGGGAGRPPACLGLMQAAGGAGGSSWWQRAPEELDGLLEQQLQQQQQAAPGRYHLFLLPAEQAAAQAVVGQHRHAWLAYSGGQAGSARSQLLGSAVALVLVDSFAAKAGELPLPDAACRSFALLGQAAPLLPGRTRRHAARRLPSAAEVPSTHRQAGGSSVEAARAPFPGQPQPAALAGPPFGPQHTRTRTPPRTHKPARAQASPPTASPPSCRSPPRPGPRCRSACATPTWLAGPTPGTSRPSRRGTWRRWRRACSPP